MKVLHLSNSTTQGGEVTFVQNLLEGQAKLINLSDASFRKLETNFYMLKDKHKHKLVLESIIKSIQLLDIAELDQFDVFHCHTWYTALSGIILKSMYPQKKLVFTVYSMEILRPWKKDSIGEDGYLLTNFLESMIFEKADILVTLSYGTVDKLIKSYPDIDMKKIYTIHPGVNEVFNQRYSLLKDFAFIKNEPPLFLFVGRGSKQKGIEHLIHASKYIKSAAKILLVIGRYDNPTYQKELEAMIAMFPEKIIYKKIDWLDQKYIANIMQHCYAFCSPSIYETFGITTAEAMTSGLPVIGTNIEGTEDIIRDHENGILVEIKNKKIDEIARDFAKNIDLLTNNEDLYISYKNSAIESSKGYQWVRSVKKYIELYNKNWD